MYPQLHYHTDNLITLQNTLRVRLFNFPSSQIPGNHILFNEWGFFVCFLFLFVFFCSTSIPTQSIVSCFCYFCFFFKNCLSRTDAEAETPIFWPPHAKSWLIGKDSDIGRDWGQDEKGRTEDEMAGWHHQLDGHEFGKLWELMVDREAWHTVIHGVEKSGTQLSNWTELNWSRCV